MELLNTVLHQIEKRSGEKELIVKFAANELPLDETAFRVANEARHLYKGRAVHGVFQEDREIYLFQSKLSNCSDKEWSNFFEFTKVSMSILEDRMRQKPASAGGYVLFVRYKEKEKQYLFVMMLNDKLGASVTKELKLKDSIHLDMSKLYVAARINISLWKDENSNKVGHKYVSFIRGRRFISDYFVDFIGCTEMTKPKESTNKIINILNDYMRNKDADSSEKLRYRDITRCYLKECAVENREASLENLSVRLNEDDPKSFFDFASHEEYQMNTFFMVDKPTISRLKGVIYNKAGFAIKMSEKYVREHVRIENNELIINDAPKELQDEIMALL